MTERPDAEHEVYRLSLRVRGEKVACEARVARRPVPVRDLLPIFQTLQQIVLDAATAGAEEEGKPVSCRAGCGACCRQVVPIAPSEARRLAELVGSMPPERRDRYRARFREALAEFDRSGLGEALRAIPESDDEDEKLAFGHAYFDRRVACPFLEDESCSIYPDRPLACREYLVTSAPEHCSAPSRDTVRRLQLPTQLSSILYRFEDGEGRGAARWLPLVLALEWAASPPEPERRIPGTRIFENLMERFTESLQRPAEAGADSPGDRPGAPPVGGPEPEVG